jgi:hypothetical protein
MKTLLAIALSLAAFNSFARIPMQTCSGKDFSNYLATGSYVGQTDQGVSCQVDVSNSGANTIVNVISGDNAVSKIIRSNSQAGCNSGLKIFVQTDDVYTNSDRTSYTENIIRTNLTNNNQLYVVTSQATVDNTDRNETVAECVIDL